MTPSRSHNPQNCQSEFTDLSRPDKHYQDADLAYMRSLSAAVVQRSPKHMIWLVVILFAFIMVTLIWMAWAKIDIVVRGDGKVIPASQVQLVQSLEGGVVTEILVREGDLVTANQPLLKLNDISFASSFRENKVKYDELLARSVRLQAEAFNQDFNPSSLSDQVEPATIEAEQSLFTSNREQLDETITIFSEQLRQQQSSLAEAKSKSRQLQRTLNLLKQEIAIKKPLMREKIISEIDFLQLQQREAELEGELEVTELSIPRLQSLIDEARGKLQQSQLDFSNQAKRELNEVNAELARIRQTQGALEDRVQRTTLRSPVEGIVKQLHANSLGGVVTPGSKAVEIVPLGDSLLVEVEIKPADIAAIEHDQLTRLKFSAYDFSIYGNLTGKVSFVSADTITNEDGESFYVVRVAPNNTYIDSDNKQLPIKVGMTSEAEIVTDKQSILRYLLKPINRGLSKALSES